MNRTHSSETSFWTTIGLLAGHNPRRRSYPDDDGEPARAMLRALRKPHSVTGAETGFVWPAVRARLERHMGSNLVRLTDKAYMRSLEDRIRRVNAENLARRIAAREQDEMERLKRLILCGKTPLKECPPELYHHPVFVFWRLVNEEVRAASKRRADAFYKKLKAFQRTSVLVLEDDLTYQSGKSEDPNVEVDSEALLELCRQSVEAAQQLDMENGFIFTDAAYDSLKYEAENVKHLKKLTTVEELYHMADQIIGYPRVV